MSFGNLNISRTSKLTLLNVKLEHRNIFYGNRFRTLIDDL